MCSSGTSTTSPTARSTVPARSRCSRPAWRPAHIPATPSCTVEGAFGIARTTGTPSARCRSIVAVGIAAATESTVCAGVSRWPISPSSVSMSCGFTASTTTSAPLIAAALSVVASTPCRSRSSAARSSRRVVATMSAQSELRSPASSDSPILPVPRIAMRTAQDYESRVVARQQVDAREAGPFAVRREQLVGLLGLDAAPPELGAQLHQPEVACEPALVAAEALEADDADRPRAEPALAAEPLRDDVARHVLQLLELERAAEADERGAAACAEAEVAELRGREAREVGARRRRVQPVELRCRRAHDQPLDLARALREDQLPRERPQESVCDGGRAERSQAAQRADRPAQQRVVAEALEELGVVVVEPEDEADVLHAGLALGAHAHDAVGALPRAYPLEPAVDRDRRAVRPVGDDARRVAREPRRGAQRVRPARTQVGGDRRIHPATVTTADASARRWCGRPGGSTRRSRRARRCRAPRSRGRPRAGGVRTC